MVVQSHYVHSLVRYQIQICNVVCNADRVYTIDDPSQQDDESITSSDSDSSDNN